MSLILRITKADQSLPHSNPFCYKIMIDMSSIFFLTNSTNRICRTKLKNIVQYKKTGMNGEKRVKTAPVSTNS